MEEFWNSSGLIMRKPKRRIPEFDPTNPEAFEQYQTEEERQQTAIEEQNAKDFLAIMETPGGRRFIRRLLDATHVSQTSFTGEPMSTVFKEGERNIGLWLMAQINDNAFDQYVTLMKERDA